MVGDEERLFSALSDLDRDPILLFSRREVVEIDQEPGGKAGGLARCGGQLTACPRRVCVAEQLQHQAKVRLNRSVQLAEGTAPSNRL